MKFSSGIDGLTKENNFLRLLTQVLLGIVVALAGLVLVIFDRPPVLIERTSRGLEIVNQMPFVRGEQEHRAAIKLIMNARFDSKSISPELFLNARQLLLKETEQRDMKNRGMAQAVVVREVHFSKDQIVVDFDRVISVGEIRSALKTKVKVAFEEVEPNELNPYGILLSEANPTENKEAK